MVCLTCLKTYRIVYVHKRWRRQAQYEVDALEIRIQAGGLGSGHLVQRKTILNNLKPDSAIVLR
jgi:hypothetical protein